MHFTHSEIGEYLFNVTELGSGTVQNGLEYDDTQYQVKVAVQYAEDADGNPAQDLKAVVTWSMERQMMPETRWKQKEIL